MNALELLRKNENVLRKSFSVQRIGIDKVDSHGQDIPSL